jgi:predicted transcriptional regulator of viral defense system
MNRAQLKELVKNIMSEESEYQAFFQKALEKAGKSIPSMSDDEKKAFFNKIDSAWDGKGEKNEGNAFGAAVTAAKKAGEDEFEVGGETYKVEEELVGGQKKLDVDKDGEIEASDLAALRAGKKANESVNEASDSLKLKGIKINKKSDVTFVLEVSFLIGDEVVMSYLTTGTQQDAQKLKSKVEKAFNAGKIVSPSGIGYYAYNEGMELPKATIPSAVKSKLEMAIDKIKDSNLTYNQKIQVVGQVMDSLGIDKAEFNKMASKLKGTMESIKEGVSSTDMDKIKGAVEAANSFMSVGSELKKLGMKYTFATEPLPIYIIQPTPNNKVAIVNKKYATKPDFVVGDIAVGIMESKSSKSVNEGRAFINAARKAKTEGLTEFEFNGKKYPVTIKD